MFGYIRPCKPQMKICDYETYKAVYCGLCKELSRFGFISRFTLSYDFAFLALLHLSVNDGKTNISRQRCMAHMLKKSYCMEHCEELTYAAAMMCISIYHKLSDDKSDEKFAKKIAALGLCGAIKGAYRKAAAMYPETAEKISEYMKLQAEIESEKCTSIDRAAEPSGLITAAILSGIPSCDENTTRILERMGYLLGRYIYITDALDDAEEDYKNKNYNPFLLQENCENCNMDEIRRIASDSVNFTLGELANAYVLLDTKRMKPILDNIIYKGLPVTFNGVVSGEKIKKTIKKQEFERI